MIDLTSRFVLPGFIDAYTHFKNAGALLMDANLLKVSGQDELRKEMARVAANLEISMPEALAAYTINNAKAAFEGDIRGSLKAGKRADITVCDRNSLAIPPEDILNMEIEMTIVEGKIVLERGAAR